MEYSIGAFRCGTACSTKLPSDVGVILRPQNSGMGIILGSVLSNALLAKIGVCTFNTTSEPASPKSIQITRFERTISEL